MVSYFVTVNCYTLKVWNIEQSCLLYQSAILSGRVILPKLSNFKISVIFNFLIKTWIVTGYIQG